MTYDDLDWFAGAGAYLTSHELSLIDAYEPEKLVWAYAARTKKSLVDAREFIDCVYERWDFQKTRA